MVGEPVDPLIVEYIRGTHERYTREAITKRLRDMGHDSGEIERAWQAVDTVPTAGRSKGWRPGWVEWLVLVSLGAVGAFLVWWDEPYGGGGFAATVYVVAASLAFGIGKAGSLLVDHDLRLWAAIAMGIVVAVLAFVSVSSPPGTLAIGAFVAALAFGVPTVVLGSAGSRVAGFAAAAYPILGWLVVTGLCYSPLVGR
jgi:hypothetical protein